MFCYLGKAARSESVSTNPVKGGPKRFAAAITTIKDDVKQLQRFSRTNNLVLCGFKSSDNGDQVYLDVINLLNKMVDSDKGKPLVRDDFNEIHLFQRGAREGRPKDILVSFLRFQDKIRVKKNYAKLKAITTSMHIGPVFFRDHLDPDSTQLTKYLGKVKFSVCSKFNLNRNDFKVKTTRDSVVLVHKGTEYAHDTLPEDWITAAGGAFVERGTRPSTSGATSSAANTSDLGN